MLQFIHRNQSAHERDSISEKKIEIIRKEYRTINRLSKRVIPLVSHYKNLPLWSFLLFACTSALFSQNSQILDSYIRQGLDNNLALKQKELNLENSLLALKEANGLFFPQVSLQSQYMSAVGGRSTDLPIGDLLNPVYSSLNQILQSMGQQGQFPQINNQKIQFLPNDYHDTKLQVVIPLVNSEIYYNRKIKKEAIQYSQAEILVYKRELVKEIKTAYFRYLQSLKVVEAYNSALELVSEAYRVNEKLVNNQMAGKEKLYRMEAEKSKVMAQLTKAENDQKIAAAYLNFLLNQPLETSVNVDTAMLEANEKPLSSVTGRDIKAREEFLQLNSALKQSEYYTKMKKSYLIPSIANITDLGYQGYYLSFSPQQQYAMNVISLQWTLFSGMQNRRQIQQANLQTSTLRNQLSETEKQIELQEKVVSSSLETAITTEQANLESLNSSKEYYKVISSGYSQGQITLLELLDARNQLTSAQVQYEVSYFETLIRHAEYERTTASYPLAIE